MGIPAKNTVVPVSNETILDDWHANMFYIGRKKSVIFCNNRTLYSVVACGVNRENIRELSKLLRRELGKALLDDGLDGALIQKLVNEVRDVSFAPTDDRTVVGIMWWII